MSGPGSLLDVDDREEGIERLGRATPLVNRGSRDAIRSSPKLTLWYGTQPTRPKSPNMGQGPPPPSSLFSLVLTPSARFVFTPKFKRRIAGTRKLSRSCHQGIDCVKVDISWFEYNTVIGFLQIAPADNDKSYDRRQEKHVGLYKKEKIRVQVILN